MAFHGSEEEAVCWGIEHQRAVDAGALKPHHLGYDLPIFSLELHKPECALENLKRYYSICVESTDLMVTTSCFAVWKEGKFRNDCAKVIPAVPSKGPGSEQVRVFFFDDNINLHLGASAGASSAKGICNLRDVHKGAYVDFSDGQNGFRRATAFRHTVLHHSAEYRNVMVQVNILDAMSNPGYFTSIIEKYSLPGEKCVIYMDVNGTILWDDTIMCLGQEEVLLCAMLGCIEMVPKEAMDFTWEPQRTCKLDPKKTKSLKQLVHDLSDGDKTFYRNFWQPGNCTELLTRLWPHGAIKWTSGDVPGQPPLTPEGFPAVFRGYMEELEQQVVAKGMTSSWFRCLEMLRTNGHAVVLQSFGMDTHRVVRHSVEDEQKVLHIAVDVELWSERDRRMFSEQFQPAEYLSDDKASLAKKAKPQEAAKDGGPDAGESAWSRWLDSLPWCSSVRPKGLFSRPCGAPPACLHL